MPREEGDMLDEVVALDETLVQRGYDSGVRVGHARGEEEGLQLGEEGLQLGRGKGSEMAVRVAVFRGRVTALKALSIQHASVFPKRALASLEQAELSLEQAVRDLVDPRGQSGFDALEAVEAKLLAVASLLKLKHRPTEESQTLDF